jgi:hypothetical protein
MKRLLVILFFSFMLIGAISAQLKAVVNEISGKVEIKSSEGSWRPARAGMNIGRGYSISTGFDSTAVLEIGQSILRVRPLTRMRLEELVQKEGTVSTDLFLKVGKVKAEVKTGSGVPQKFTLKGPVSTAAVRGTEFEFDGFTVKVTNGSVVFLNTLGQGRGVSGGEDSSTDGLEPPTSGDEEKDLRAQVNPYVSPSGNRPSGEPAAQMTRVTIRWQ